MSLKQEERDSITLIQRAILGITEETKASVAERITRSHYNNIEQVPYLFNFILIASEIRPKSIGLIADLCVSLKESIPSFHGIAIQKMNKEVFKEPIREGKPVLHIELFYHLYKRGFVSLDVIRDVFNWIYDKYFESICQLGLFMFWFKFEPEVYALFKTYIEAKLEKRNFNSQNHELRSCTSSRATHRPIVYHPYYNAYSLRGVYKHNETDRALIDIFINDDVNSLQEYMANDYVSSHGSSEIKSDAESLIEELLAELEEEATGHTKQESQILTINAHPFLQYQPTMLNIAEFYGAVDCFKFLIANGVCFYSPKPPNNPLNAGDECKYFNDAHYAVAGGNIEIIRIVEQGGISFDGCAPIAAYFHHNDVYSWLVETKGINNEFEETYNAIAETNNISLYSREHFIFPYVPFVASKKGNYEFIKLFEATDELFNKTSKSNHSHIYYAMKHDFPKIVEYLDNHCIESLYWATKRGYNNLAKKILEHPNAKEIVKLTIKDFDVLDVALSKNNEELIQIYQSMNVVPSGQKGPVPSLFPRHFFARGGNEFQPMYKISYDPSDTYETVCEKLKKTKLKNLSGFRFRGKVISRGRPIIEYGIHRGNIIDLIFMYLDTHKL